MQRHLKYAPPVIVLSVEEEAIAVDELNTATVNLVAMDTDITRVEDTKEIITDVQSVVAQVPEMGAVEQSLVEAVSDMATAGTDAAPEDILAVAPDGVVTEGIGTDIIDYLKKIWEKIKEFFDRAWEMIKGFFRNITGFTKPVEQKLDKIDTAMAEKGQAQAESGSTPEHAGAEKPFEAPTRTHNKFQFHGNLGKLSLKQGQLCPPKQLVSELTRLNAVTEKVLGAMIDSCEKLMKIVSDTVGEMVTDLSQTTAVVDKMAPAFNAEMEKLMDVMKIKAGDPIERKNRGGIYEAYDGPPVLLGGTFFYASLIFKGDNSDKRFDKYKIRMLENDYDNADKSKIEPVEPQDVKRVRQLGEEWLKLVRNNNLSDRISHVENISDRVEKLIGNLKTMSPSLNDINASSGDDKTQNAQLHTSITHLISGMRQVVTMGTMQLRGFVTQVSSVYTVVSEYTAESVRYHNTTNATSTPW